MKQTTKKPAAPAIERPHRNLTQTQEELADIASDILLNGGEREDVDLMLRALTSHNYRNLSFARESAVQDIDGNTKRRRENYYQQLSKHWPEKRQETKEEPSDQERPVVEMVRANIRESFRKKVDELLTDDDGIETVWLLNEIVEDINSGDEPGEAIYRAMDRADIYVRVPWQHKKRIEEFVAFLEKGRAA